MLDHLCRKTVPSTKMTREAPLSRLGWLGKTLAKTLALGGLVIMVAGGKCDEGVGDPCTPEQEYNSDFLGFDVK